MNYTFQFNIILAHWPELVHGALLSLLLALAGFWSGAPFALVLAAVRTSGPVWSKRIAGAYVTFLTNTPVLIQIYFLFFGLPELGIRLDKYMAVIVGLVMATSALMAARSCAPASCRCGAARSKPRRRSASRAAQTIRYVMVPHIVKTIYPALANYFIVLMLVDLDGDDLRRR